MPMTWTAGRARCGKPYFTARFTMVATLFQFNPYWRAVPCQLNSRASVATAFDSAVVTRAQGSAQGKSSTRTPHLRHSTRRGRARSFNGTFRMERSLHSRGFRTPCTFRHRCRQSPQRSIRFPSRSMWMIMYLSVSSTLVTVCAFNLSCFLGNVSMSTSILFLSVAVHHSPQKIRCIGDSDQPLHRQPAASKTLRLQLHFRDGNQNYYLHGGGGIGVRGNCTDICVSLQDKLPHYRLPDPPSGARSEEHTSEL